MAQCTNDSRYSCIGPGGSCNSLRSGCAHAKKDREDAERDAGQAGGEKKTNWIVIAIVIVIAIYIFGK